MGLATTYAGEFSSAVQERGGKYYRTGAVRIEYGSPVEMQAVVRGSRRYEVDIYLDGGRLVAACDCPHTSDGNLCKHVWACLLAADVCGHLSAVRPETRLTLDYDLEDDLGYAGFDEEDDEEDYEPYEYSRSKRSKPPPQKPAPALPDWRKQVEDIAKARFQSGGSGAEWPAKRQILYLVDAHASNSSGMLVLSLVSRDRKIDGSWSRATSLSLKRSQIAQLPLAEDRDILSTLAGACEHVTWGYYDGYEQVRSHCEAHHPMGRDVVRKAALSGRCYLQRSDAFDEALPITWDDGEWRFGLELRRSASGGWRVSGLFRRGEERMDAAEPLVVTRGGLVFTRDRAAPLAQDTAFDWLLYFRKSGVIEAPEQDCDELLQALLCSTDLPPLEVPEELRFEESAPQPKPRLLVRAGERIYGSERLFADLSFDYEGRIVPALEKSRGFYDAAARRFLRRDSVAEKAASDLLQQAGFRFQIGYYGQPAHWDLAPTKLPRAVRALVEAGWHVEAEGKVFRRPGAFRIDVSSGVDWFELHGDVQYGENGEASAKLPQLLEALRRGEKMVPLGDGTYGVLPEEWLGRIGVLAGMGTPEDGHIRFRRSQAGLLDALLAAEPDACFDENFALVRQELRRFQGVAPAEQPAGFEGSLRDYQRDGLGWLHFLRRFSFGGCLADDMGVGKTAQALALLEGRRELRAAGETLPPSLVVVPKSLIFNWKEEAARFTPRLRVLDYTGPERNSAEFANCDVVLTTYGTLRRDILRLKKAEFDYIILDEAQAIKNASAESAKAARLLRGAHRLALSGTPVENHLGELWSLFEFLNPGMLGAASVFKLAGGAARNPNEETRHLLAHALRPFILRRTKEQVARELPAKTEQTVYCEMDVPQRRLYNELRQHYRNSLLKRIDKDGMAKSKIQVLEALLRLRQAACHPGLLDKGRAGESSAKLDSLLEQVREVLDEGHKALVFSQFTSLLAIVRNRLDESNIAYEYLDGATRDRRSPVERFQTDPDCRLFLISLKAGGLGLNLTAADYVFLLDPWWNPAVEAQAVDRAHRIGQTQQVFAYRLIARDTVEEKVLELQKTKRDLAAAIIGEDNSLIRSLRREDLELLLS